MAMTEPPSLAMEAKKLLHHSDVSRTFNQQDFLKSYFLILIT